MSSRLRVLHEEIDAAVEPLTREHRARLRCELGCTDCCVDELTVFEIEAERIRAAHRELLASGVPHAPGKCAFLGPRGECRIYDARPYVCRTQGLPLRWLTEDEAGDPVEMRDICPLNESADRPIETEPAESCWTLGPFEGQLAQLESEARGGAPVRVALRSLFSTR